MLWITARILWTRLESQEITFFSELNHFNPCFVQVDKFKSYPDLMALLFKAMAKSPPAKRRK